MSSGSAEVAHGPSEELKVIVCRPATKTINDSREVPCSLEALQWLSTLSLNLKPMQIQGYHRDVGFYNSPYLNHEFLQSVKIRKYSRSLLSDPQAL
jgi:hypothetical protein